jgi:hypothetical protein
MVGRRIEVHLLEPLTFIFEPLAGNNFETLEQRLGFLAPMRLDDADDYVIAVQLSRSDLLQHFVSLAHTWSSADKNFQAPGTALFPPRRLQ